MAKDKNEAIINNYSIKAYAETEQRQKTLENLAITNNSEDVKALIGNENTMYSDIISVLVQNVEKKTAEGNIAVNCILTVLYKHFNTPPVVDHPPLYEEIFQSVSESTLELAGEQSLLSFWKTFDPQIGID